MEITGLGSGRVTIVGWQPKDAGRAVHSGQRILFTPGQLNELYRNHFDMSKLIMNRGSRLFGLPRLKTGRAAARVSMIADRCGG